MKKIGIGSWAYIFGPYESHPIDFKTVVENLSQIGFDAVSIAGFRPHIFVDDYADKAKRDEFLKLLSRNHLEAAEFSPDPCGLNPVVDPAPYIKRMKRNIDFLEDCGFSLFRLDTACPPVLPEGVSYQKAYDNTVFTFQKLSEYAAEKGITVVWEFEPGFLFNKPSEILQIYEDVAEPNFKILFDCCHAYMCSVIGARQFGQKETLPGGVMEFLERLKGKIGMVHLIDSDGTLHDNDTSTHAPFGTGVLDIHEIYQKLLDPAYYEGELISIDLCFWPDAWNVTKDSYNYLRSLQLELEANC